MCSPIPGGYGATCDNFLTSNQQILDAAAWQALQNKWIASGQAVECTNSNAFGDIKREIEQLCSLAKCDYQTQQKIISGLSKIERLGK